MGARLSLPELRAVERLDLAGIIGIGDVEGPFQDELAVVGATWLSAPKLLDSARMYSARERGCRVEVWTSGARLRDRMKAALKPRLMARGVIVRGVNVRMPAAELEAEIRAAAAAAGVTAFGLEEAQRLINEAVQRDLQRAW